MFLRTSIITLIKCLFARDLVLLLPFTLFISWFSYCHKNSVLEESLHLTFLSVTQVDMWNVLRHQFHH